MPARLSGGLLARKGEAKPSGGLDTASGDLARSRPAGGTLTRPAAARAPMAEIVVAAGAPGPATAGPNRPGLDDRVSLTVRIDRTLHSRLRALAGCQQRTNQDIVQGALEAYLNVFATGCACVGGFKPKA